MIFSLAFVSSSFNMKMFHIVIDFPHADPWRGKKIKAVCQEKGFVLSHFAIPYRLVTEPETSWEPEEPARESIHKSV